MNGEHRTSNTEHRTSKEIRFEVDLLADGPPRGKRGGPLMPCWERRVEMWVDGKRRSLTARRVRVWKRLIRLAFRRAAPRSEPHDGPVRLRVTLFRPTPKSWPKWRQRAAAEETMPSMQTPDWDNVGKLVSDALNGRAWVDDRQVFDGRSLAFYSPRPRLEVVVGFEEPAGRRGGACAVAKNNGSLPAPHPGCGHARALTFFRAKTGQSGGCKSPPVGI